MRKIEKGMKRSLIQFTGSIFEISTGQMPTNIEKIVLINVITDYLSFDFINKKPLLQWNSGFFILFTTFNIRQLC